VLPDWAWYQSFNVCPESPRLISWRELALGDLACAEGDAGVSRIIKKRRPNIFAMYRFMVVTLLKITRVKVKRNNTEMR
jgi:hypothetical protein